MRSFIHNRFILIAALLLVSQQAFPQASPRLHPLREKILKFIESTGARVGVGIYGLDFKDSLLINENRHYPMQSVYKLPLAISIMDRVDKGNLFLGKNIYIPQRYIEEHTWSPMADDYPQKAIDISLDDLLRYTVSKSDNNGCDALFRLQGGPAPVNKFIHGLGIREIAIAATEAEMKMAWSVQYTNWCQPSAMLQLLAGLYKGSFLSRRSSDYLIRLMTESTSSANRLKGLLPAGTVVAHKTGTSGENEDELIAATNDAGIITLPDGRHYAIVVYVSDYTGGYEKGEHIIATISRLAWDHFNAR